MKSVGRRQHGGLYVNGFLKIFLVGRSPLKRFDFPFYRGETDSVRDGKSSYRNSDSSSAKHASSMHEKLTFEFYETQTHHTRRIYLRRKWIVDNSGEKNVFFFFSSPFNISLNPLKQNKYFFFFNYHRNFILNLLTKTLNLRKIFLNFFFLSKVQSF